MHLRVNRGKSAIPSEDKWLASRSDRLAVDSSEGLERQRVETEQVSAAVNQMAATTQEVASHVQRTADATQEANVLTGRGRDVARDTRSRLGAGG